MKTLNKRIARFTNRLPLLLYAALLGFSSWSQAQDAGPAPAGSDSLEYFFDKYVQVSDSGPHPTRSGTGDHGSKSPLELWSGPNKSTLRMTLQAEMLYANQDASWFGEDEANLGESSSSWWETVVIPGLVGNYFSGKGDEWYAKLTAVASSTTDIDAAGSNVGYGDTSDVWAEDAYIGWRSGTRWSDLGKDFLNMSFGRQQYVAGNGFLFYSQSSNGGERGGYWMGSRTAADLAGVVQVNYKDLAVDLIYLEADDQDADTDPNNNTKVGGITLDYALGDFGGVGGGYYSVSSEEKPRDGMDIVDLRFSITPFKQFLPKSWAAPLVFEGEYVYQDNGDAMEAEGWYASGKYAWSDAAWSPTLTYRYSSFEGGVDADGKSKNYDPLFYGFYDWGYWYQGEVLGEYVLSNSNLNTSMVMVGLDPTDSIHVNLFYYHNELDDAAAFGVTSDEYADEYNITIDWTANDYLLFSLVGAYVDPDDAAIESTGGDDDWYYVMLYASFTFK